MTRTDAPPDTEDSDQFTPVRENEAAVEKLTDRDDRIGAAARIALALARNDRPDMRDLDQIGIPPAQFADFTNSEGPQ